MKPELQSKLVEILTSIQAAAGKASDFAIEQLPDIAQTYVTYGRISTTLGVVVGLALIGAAVWAARFIWKQNKGVGYLNEPMGLNIFGGLGTVAAGLIGFGMTICDLQSALLVWFAPKVWLLKEIAGLIK